MKDFFLPREMVQELRVGITKHDNLSWTTGTHIIEDSHVCPLTSVLSHGMCVSSHLFPLAHTYAHTCTNICVNILKTLLLWLEGWLSSQEHMLPFHETRSWFLAHVSGGSQLHVSLNSKGSNPFFRPLWVPHTGDRHSYTHI